MTLPFTRPIFDLVPLAAGDWMFLLPLSLVPVSIIEIAKLVRAAFRTNHEDRPTSEAERKR